MKSAFLLLVTLSFFVVACGRKSLSVASSRMADGRPSEYEFPAEIRPTPLGTPTLSPVPVATPVVEPVIPPGPSLGGIRGIIFSAKACPGGMVCPDELGPLSTSFYVQSPTAVMRYTSDANGIFSIILPPGAYRILPIPPGQTLAAGAYTFPPVPVFVEEGAWTQVQFTATEVLPEPEPTQNVRVFRYSNGSDHIQSIVANSFPATSRHSCRSNRSKNWVREAGEFFLLKEDSSDCNIPIMECESGDGHFLSDTPTCEGQRVIRQAGFACRTAKPGFKHLARLVKRSGRSFGGFGFGFGFGRGNSDSDQVATTEEAEIQSGTWTLERYLGYVPMTEFTD